MKLLFHMSNKNIKDKIKNPISLSENILPQFGNYVYIFRYDDLKDKLTRKIEPDFMKYEFEHRYKGDIPIKLAVSIVEIKYSPYTAKG